MSVVDEALRVLGAEDTRANRAHVEWALKAATSSLRAFDQSPPGQERDREHARVATKARELRDALASMNHYALWELWDAGLRWQVPWIDPETPPQGEQDVSLLLDQIDRIAEIADRQSSQPRAMGARQQRGRRHTVEDAWRCYAAVIPAAERDRPAFAKFAHWLHGLARLEADPGADDAHIDLTSHIKAVWSERAG